MKGVRFYCTVAAMVLLNIGGTTKADGGPSVEFRQTATELAGTAWVGIDGPLGRVTFLFERGGVLQYTYPNGQIYRNGTWEQRGNVLYFEVNEKFREYRARIGRDVVSGASWNRAGQNWQTTLTLAKSP
jgi:hypothetical protein